MLRHFLLAATLMLLSACGGNDHNNTNALTPLLSMQNEPSDEAVKQAVAAYVAGIGAPAASTFSYVRYDLNDDGHRDALVLMKSPYGYWCGNDMGCALLVFRAESSKMKFVNKVQPVRPPIYVVNSSTNGWRDLVARVSGRQERPKDVLIRYNGINYPIDPSRLSAHTLNPFGDHVRVFVN